MSLLRSILQPRESTTELPLWHTPTPSVPPPPVAHSVATLPPMDLPPVDDDDELAVLQSREEQALHDRIQALLDAQAAALTAPPSNAHDTEAHTLRTTTSRRPSHNSSSTNDDTHTISSRASHVSSTHPSKPLALNPTRRALHRAMLANAQLKNRELSLVHSALADEKSILAKLDTWAARSSALEAEIASQAENAERETRTLRAEEERLGNAIRATEAKLADLRRREAQVKDALRTRDGEGQARLASFRAALAEVQRTSGAFLERLPRPRSGGDEFFSLPPARRTLGAAREAWSARAGSLAARGRAARREAKALEVGARVWKGICEEVRGFESQLRRDMPRLLDEPEVGRALLEEMERVIEVVREGKEGAEARGWNLLVACAGAELEALEEGRRVLRGAVGGDAVKESGESDMDEHEELYGDGSLLLGRREQDGPGEESRLTAVRRDLLDSGDEDPDPDLMVSRAVDSDAE
ncbi:hypothetical protein EJ06DRAFT_527660 [Trichodelitschia bisporula]|uniref:Uncharacterized protein n=1 Tax=Trichodelitschia bisporula TaxID=703511 RepID=A0A6G1I3I5_9PEZI|nr:hypothetical protein EJ06DRAFT_527660 [Trichodelitschia bisporula]